MRAIQFSSKLEEYKNKLWKYHIKVPPDIVIELKKNDIKRFKCLLNGKKEIHAALMPAGENVYFIKLNTQLKKELRLSLGDKVEIKLSKDTSRYGMELPSEFKELLELDKIGRTHFEALTPGKKRNLIFLVSKLKSSSKRIEKGFIILDHLKDQQGELNFKILYEDFKIKKGLI